MAPFRAARSTRSGGRPGAPGDFDIVDGLPVRQWRLQEATLGLEPPIEDLQDVPTTNEVNDPAKAGAWPELQMPRGSQMYAPWCQQLLRAARAGRLQKRKRDNEADDDRDNEAIDEHAQSDLMKSGFSVRRWAQLPRQMEQAEPEYLAERRRGLPREQPGFINGIANGVIDAVAVEVPEEPVRRRMPPPPRKKNKKGRKRKLAFTDGEGVSAAAEDEVDVSKPSATRHGSTANGGDDDGDDDEDDDDDADENGPPATNGNTATDIEAIRMPSLAEVPSASVPASDRAAATILAPEPVIPVQPANAAKINIKPTLTEAGPGIGSTAVPDPLSSAGKPEPRHIAPSDAANGAGVERVRLGAAELLSKPTSVENPLDVKPTIMGLTEPHHEPAAEAMNTNGAGLKLDPEQLTVPLPDAPQ